jgi:beta-galactosidase
MLCFRLTCILLALVGAAAGTSLGFASDTIDLAGQWRFAMDCDDAGQKEEWFTRDLADRIQLPGILQAQGYGDEISVDTKWVAGLPRDMRWYLRPEYKAYTQSGHVKVPYFSQPPRHYLGVAWYQRDFEIPEGLKGRRIHLLLERPRWETKVWVDDREISSNNSLVAPHEHELGILTPGKHRLTVRADNRMSVVPGYRPDGHSVSDALGATWNGIAGRIELTATSPVWIDDAQVFPDVAKKSARVKVHIGNLTGEPGAGTLSVEPSPLERGQGEGAGKSVPVTWDANGGDAELEVPLGDDAKLWDEFQPALSHLSIQLRGGPADDQRQLTFGLREITTHDKQMLLNGREINLRGTHFGGDFPLTGYPATDMDSWKKIIQTCKDFGLNHMRFHSWCPPEAAFTAADELGFYLQPEAGMWNQFRADGVMARMLETETARMIRAYGNHPSFLLFSPSNEPNRPIPAVLTQWCKEWHDRDPRRLYAAKTGWEAVQSDLPQYDITSAARGNRGWFGADYSRAVANARMPIVAHEVGQWCAYPDFDVIQKFTGYLQPSNYEIFRDSAAAHGVLAWNKDFAWASGRFQLACYKEEVEANLRTPGLAGFQLLDLHDYLGQGGALIGVLDAFWGNKGYVTAEEFRRFCSPTVPLARFHSYLFKTSDPLEVSIEIAHFGAGPIADATPVWRIVDLDGKVMAQGELVNREIPLGKTTLGKVTADLSKLPAPRQYKLVVGLRSENPGGEQQAKIENDWNFWLYPAEVDAATPADVKLTSDWKDAAAQLASGGKVLFVPPAAALDDTCPPLNNVPVFWNRLMNPKLESMLGLWCDTKHPALAEFPTGANCDWQWADLVRGVRAVNLDHAPRELRPIVQAIDDWSRNYRLGVVFECQVGAGRLLVCTVELEKNLDDRPAARQLRKSLLDYMAGNQFQPQIKLTPDQATALWPGLTGHAFKAGPQAAPIPEVNENANPPPGKSG